MKRVAFATALALALLTAGPALAQDAGGDRLDQALAMINDDPPGARAILEEMSKAGNAEAMNALASILEYDNDNWPGEPARATALREDALRGGSKAAALNIALGLMMDGQADHGRAVELLKLADSEENLRGLTAYAWGRAYMFGWGVDRDIERAVGFFEAFVTADPDSRNAMRIDADFLLGRAYRNGWNVPVDHVRAFQHFKMAADLGDPRAQWNAGMMLLEGAGIPASEEQAYSYVKMSAQGGYLDGMISHAVMLAMGQGVAEDDAAARDWYLAAAERGSAHALRGLGFMLVRGEGGEASPALGVAMLQLAAEAGEQNAMTLLGMIDGLPPAEDIATAREMWLTEYGEPDALN